MQRTQPQNRVRTIRRRRRLTQGQVATLIGKSQQLLSAVERGFRRPTTEIRRSLSVILGVGVTEIFPRQKNL